MKKFPILQRLKEITTKIGNVGNTDLQTQVTTLNNKITPAYSNVTGGILSLSAHKLSNIVFILVEYINPSSSVTAGTWYTLGVLPDGYKPSATRYFGGTFADENGTPIGFRGSVPTNGEIKAVFSTSFNTSTSLFGMFMIAI